MDFGGFKSVTSSNGRKTVSKGAKEQAYADMKYRRAVKKVKKGEEGKLEGRFYVSNARFKEWNLEGVSGNGLRQFTDEVSGDTVLAVVSLGDSIILKSSKKGKKGKNFKSTRLEAALDKLKVIDATLKDGENQLITLTKVADTAIIDGVSCLQVYKLSKGTVIADSVEAEAKAAPEAVKTPEVAAAPATDASWD